MGYQLNDTGEVIQTTIDEGYRNQPKANAAWDDLRFPLIGRNIDSNVGRVDTNFFNGTLDFATNARYPNEPVTMLAQMSHSMKDGSLASPHIHWQQTQAGTPNWLLAYQVRPNGDTGTLNTDYSNHTLVPCSQNIYTYTSGNLNQICEFGDFIPPSIGTSGMIHFVLFRDTANVSGLFAGIDTYGAIARAFEFDIHYQKDQLGSREEYTK